MSNKIPYDSGNSKNPWLIDVKARVPLIGPEGIPLSAEYIWTKCGKDREELLEWVLQYYIENGINVFQLSDKKIVNEFEKLKNKDPYEIERSGTLINSGLVGLNIAKHFTIDLFLQARGYGKARSCAEVLANRELL